MAAPPTRGLVKAKKYDWKDSNLALFGSDTEKSIKKESAQTEAAWKGAGLKPGLQVWRINKFKVEHWPKEDYGSFFNGDSYIILNTYKKPDSKSEELLYDVHFWIGQYSTQDEYGTAAYKTVELDHLLDDKPVQHREVMDYESDLFKTYFAVITKMEGGADTGFRHVGPKNYTPRLLQFKGAKKNVTLRERPLNKHVLDSSDVFILDLGLKIFQWNGETANKDEKTKAMQHLQKLKGIRGKATSQVLESARVGPDHQFMKALADDPLDEEDFAVGVDNSKPALFRLKNTDKLYFTKEAEGTLPKSKLDSSDVFILDNTKELYVWVGKGADTTEKRNAFSYAHKYLQDTPHPFIPITCLNEGHEKPEFFKALS
ncbi:gelsolin-like protein 2 [Asterias rubens]|uniref:gelsolin-like protein 2 n=1 Tax=Asterias rubens TaxID=7604 RepID=UPI001455BFBA|nr:gelsolin-like protein 2 [Asterias rubens]